MTDVLRVIPLGGLGEVGKNMMVYELGDERIVVDAGMAFPRDEDHVGALPFLMREVRVNEIWATRLTLGLVKSKLDEHGLLRAAELREADPEQGPIELGPFKLEFIRMAHSIPDAVGIAIETAAGLVFHSGDWKLDHTPVDGLRTDVGRLASRGNMNVARNLGYVEVPEEVLVKPADLDEIPVHQQLIICTGSQGEPLSALTRIAYNDHPAIKVERGDTVIISARPVPGNELRVHDAINRLTRNGAEVLHEENAPVHVSGHARAEELRTLLSLVRPKAVMPIHGEYRMQAAHARLAQDAGVPASSIVIAENGDVVELSPDGVRIADH